MGTILPVCSGYAVLVSEELPRVVLGVLWCNEPNSDPFKRSNPLKGTFQDELIMPCASEASGVLHLVMYLIACRKDSNAWTARAPKENGRLFLKEHIKRKTIVANSI